MSYKSVKLCECCGGITAEEFSKEISDVDVSVGCVGDCGKSAGKTFGKINGNLIICDTKHEFIEAAKKELL